MGGILKVVRSHIYNSAAKVNGGVAIVEAGGELEVTDTAIEQSSAISRVLSSTTMAGGSCCARPMSHSLHAMAQAGSLAPALLRSIFIAHGSLEPQATVAACLRLIVRTKHSQMDSVPSLYQESRM